MHLGCLLGALIASTTAMRARPWNASTHTRAQPQPTTDLAHECREQVLQAPGLDEVSAVRRVVGNGVVERLQRRPVSRACTGSDAHSKLCTLIAQSLENLPSFIMRTMSSKPSPSRNLSWFVG